MVTLCVRYKFNPDKIAGIRNYFENEQRVIERSGGRTVGCFLPTDFAGPTDEAIWLIDLPSMAAYVTYRQVLADDSENKTNVARLEESGAGVAMTRSFIQRVAAKCRPRSERHVCSGSRAVVAITLAARPVCLRQLPTHCTARSRQPRANRRHPIERRLSTSRSLREVERIEKVVSLGVSATERR